MPSINRIRVNNVKYNFGTQQYDDFVMRMYGKNTLYDLANGGGKSVLMLLLLQNLIPNCTLDDKQPIEKLFRNGGGNTVIHSLIEWRLDDENVPEGYRYMTTGFCARKAKDEAEGKEEDTLASKKDTASIEYFNYCILYREYNRNDIVNLPLSRDNERITFAGLKSYLKDLAKKDFNLSVQVFERKGEYQRYISRFGLYESHWEIIRGINKTEGHVRTYFESNYKTTRKVVEDLLIEEIIEKAYLVKTEQNEDVESMAKNLMDIKDKLVELTKKKREIANYDRQTELLHVLEGRVTSFLALFEKRDKLCQNIANVYVTGKAMMNETKKKLEVLEKQKEEKLAKKQESRRNLECLKIKELEYQKEVLMVEIEKLVALVGENKSAFHSAELDLKRKESMNDYMDYKRDEQLKNENEALLMAATSRTGADMNRMAELAYTKRKMCERKTASVQKEYEKITAKLEAVEKEEAAGRELLAEAQIALEVAKANAAKAGKEARSMLSAMGKLKQEANVMVLADAKELLEKNEEDIQTQEMLIHSLEEEREAHTKYYYEKCQERDRLTKEVEDAKKEMAGLQAKLDAYLDNADRIKNMMRIYNVEDQKNLLAAINKRCIQCIVDATNKREELGRLAKKRAELAEHRIIGETPAVAKVKEYIETRHNEAAVCGMDYVAARTVQEREELLGSFPLLPYGVVVKSFDFLRMDEALQELNLGDAMVPVFSEEMLYNPMGRIRDDAVLFLSKGRQHFTDEELIKAAIEDCDQQIKELDEAVARLSELGMTYEEDMDYISALGSDVALNTMDVMNEKKSAFIALEKALEQAKEISHDLMLAIEQDDETLREEKDKLSRLYSDQKRLVEVKVISEQMSKVDEDKKQAEEEIRRLTEKEQQLRTQSTDLAVELADYRIQSTTLQNILKETEESWAMYEPYYHAGAFSEVDISEEQIDAEFKACKAVIDKESVKLGDKKKLVDTLKQSMQRAKRSIEKRGFTLEDMQKLDKAHSIFEVDDKTLNELSMYVSQLSTDGGVLQNQLEQKRSVMYHLDGTIEQSVKQLEEQFGAYESMNVSVAEVGEAIKNGDKVLKALDMEYKQIEQEYKQGVKQYNTFEELYKDVKRIMVVNGIKQDNAIILHESEENMRTLFEDSLLDYDKGEKALGRAKADLLKYKSHTAETLYSMQAFELSETIGRDVAVPETYRDATALLSNLSAMIDFIALEKERVSKGIQDMELIKSSFENQCIQRCKDVKTELDKLPKLSRILVDGEPVQMVGLTIPYVKEEFIKQRMSDYIDDVVAGADKFDDMKDRMKYIRNRLVLKKLFGVIVTDMNAIKLTLYKRERIKEQSRYLRYEEAVGSTGQSQGIYIQFLISIINYISGMYGANVENDKRRKTIFIDNPFGAAKDIYIWEPIFALLKTNRVQLIVPARGATPAITARFDVNYILGQQMVGKKQQTVVIDYRSQVEQEEMEYTELDYEQETLEFI